MPPFPSIRVANWFIDQSLESGIELTNMKLQKLVYIAHGLHLGIIGIPLLDEDIQAWQYGPVVPSVYHEAKKYGNQQIEERLLEVTSKGYGRPSLSEATKTTELKQSMQILEGVWGVYGTFDGVTLSNKTHEPGTPWSNTWADMEKQGLSRSRISNQKIKTYYKDTIRQIDQNFLEPHTTVEPAN